MSVWSLSAARRASAIKFFRFNQTPHPEERPLGRVSKDEPPISSWFETAHRTTQNALPGAPPHHEDVLRFRRSGALCQGLRLLHFRQPRRIAGHQIDFKIDLAAGAPAA